MNVSSVFWLKNDIEFEWNKLFGCRNHLTHLILSLQFLNSEVLILAVHENCKSTNEFFF